jgi:hypothetical protein
MHKSPAHALYLLFLVDQPLPCFNSPWGPVFVSIQLQKAKAGPWPNPPLAALSLQQGASPVAFGAGSVVREAVATKSAYRTWPVRFARPHNPSEIAEHRRRRPASGLRSGTGWDSIWRLCCIMRAPSKAWTTGGQLEEVARTGREWRAVCGLRWNSRGARGANTKDPALSDQEMVWNLASRRGKLSTSPCRPAVSLCFPCRGQGPRLLSPGLHVA